MYVCWVGGWDVCNAHTVFGLTPVQRLQPALDPQRRVRVRSQEIRRLPIALVRDVRIAQDVDFVVVRVGNGSVDGFQDLEFWGKHVGEGGIVVKLIVVVAGRAEAVTSSMFVGTGGERVEGERIPGRGRMAVGENVNLGRSRAFID